ncbi:MAG: diguanylate cyclase [bacterium]|nr:diguanylate cyclase [bacterium]
MNNFIVKREFFWRTVALTVLIFVLSTVVIYTACWLAREELALVRASAIIIALGMLLTASIIYIVWNGYFHSIQISRLNAQLEQRVSERTKELQQANQSIQQRVTELETVRALASSIAYSHNLEEIFWIALPKILESSNMDAGWVFIKDRDLGTYSLSFYHGELAQVSQEEARQAVNECLCPKVLLAKEILVTNRVGECVRFTPEFVVKAGIVGYVCVPLIARKEVLGILLLASTKEIQVSKAEVELLSLFGSELGIALETALLFQDLERQATTDGLTGLYNRRHLDEVFHREVERAKRKNAKMSMLLIDVYNFKYYNDTLGHPAGDNRLKTVARLLKRNVRASDIVVRYGGDEFVVLMPETDETQAFSVKQRIEQAVVQWNNESDIDRQDLALFLNIGVKTAGKDDADDLIALADKEMYKAKGTIERRKLIEFQERSESDRQRYTLQAVLSLAKVVEFKDPYTRGHSERVKEYAVAIAQQMNLSRKDIDEIAYAALLHDIGKISVSSAILNKRDRLTPEEYRIVYQHPVVGEIIVRDVELLSNIAAYIRHHHERFDGNMIGVDYPGYPDGLSGEDIPLASRILAVADVFDAMTSDRPYRLGIAREQAIAEMKSRAGTQFDPKVIEAFLAVQDRLVVSQNTSVGAR